ncbi:MAG: hypothetical protein K6E20_06895 [Acholeplasmatales bacterium]|nr:hypothetical protein [Acholeplasmatales bacterium]
MEKNQFEGLEELEKDEVNAKEVKELKEYEKLLKAEENRKFIDKAQTLIEFGCFNQIEVTQFDFNGYDFVDGKKFKDKYNLYKNKNSEELVYVCPLIENNEGSEDENKAMKPYAYDCIYIEAMDEEIYKKVVVAGKNNVSTLPQKLIKASWIAYIVYASISLFTTLYIGIYSIDQAHKDSSNSSDTKELDAFISSLATCGALLAGAIVALAILTLVTLKYKDYKKN